MPKMKTRKAVKARFKVTGRKKLVRFRPGKGHLLTKKTAKRKRNLKKSALVDEGYVKTYKHLMCVK
ncbi:MAG TPA: 50S ribosomal protein L35 [Parachlamydiales bacterium]|nr:MAG: 50S ribosomal protein L35 [Chlamydiae bacterium GWA2_50_15]OGN69474.1 MAG: 50S ribosomal protein L35 [Chlamydiae bacterium RIFCSPLOWO2_02_FULL_49_12]HAZ15422.1 50S ribosomal protein L35 [Parachlamydiales bacterium]HCJ84482.1 50S ribosomal protein L35 [Parachlamydiales bacterium]